MLTPTDREFPLNFRHLISRNHRRPYFEGTMSSNTLSLTLRPSTNSSCSPPEHNSGTETPPDFSSSIVADIIDPKPEAGQLWFKPVEAEFYMVIDKDACEQYEALKAEVEQIRRDPSLPNRIDLPMDVYGLIQREVQKTQTRSEEPSAASAGRTPLGELPMTHGVLVMGRQRQSQSGHQHQGSMQGELDEENLEPR